jgi:raffinose/stachyose/melibiose transport system substrate-binding protein
MSVSIPPPRRFNRDIILNSIGFGLIAVCFAVSLYQVTTRKVSAVVSGQKVVRIAHWQLESGLRTAFDDLAVAYNKLHPDVRIEQLPIPDKIYGNWYITQLVGGNPPELMQIFGWPGSGPLEERLARYFLPLTREVSLPNPYDQGTPLEKLPWRSTFVDGLTGIFSYNPVLLEVYGVGLNSHAQRMGYNKALYAEIFGPEAVPPTTYHEFIQVCDQATAWAKKNHRILVPISSSLYHSQLILTPLMQTQVQRFQQQLDKLGNFLPAGSGNELAMIAYLQGAWDLNSPMIRSSLQITRDIGRNMTPGFLSLKREDATFYFLQQRALFITTGSWDIGSLTTQAQFPIGIFRVPMPSRDDPQYGQFVLGPLAEGQAGSATNFGLTRSSQNREIALDFLRFATSQKGNKIFADASNWYPIISGVEPPAAIKPFQPITDGYPGGINFLRFSEETIRLMETNLYRLWNQEEAINNFVDAVGPKYRPAIINDLSKINKIRRANICRADSAFASFLWQQQSALDPDRERKLNEININQSIQEASFYELTTSLAELNITPTP